MREQENQSEIILYTTPDGEVKIDTVIKDESILLTQKKMAELFDVDVSTINEHLKNIYNSHELQENATIGKFPIVQKEGNRDVKRNIAFYNLDVIISVGYRVNSKRATQFRIWATDILKEYIIKGFAMDDDRLKQVKNWSYFDEWLERIRNIYGVQINYVFVKEVTRNMNFYNSDKQGSI